MTTGPLIDKAHAAYLKELERVNKRLYDQLLVLLSQYTKKGVLIADAKELSNLEGEIRKIIKDSGYTSATDDLLKTFPEIENDNTIHYDKAENIKIKPLMGGDNMKFIQEKLIFDLKGQGASINLIKPLADIIRQGNFQNRTFKEVSDILRIKVIDKPYLNRYADNLVRSALYQYNGAINNNVRVAFDLKWCNYIGSIIENSRPFCDHLRDLGDRSLHEDEIRKSLNEFCPDGKPSEVSVTYTTVNGVKQTKPKGSGMTEGTTFETFTQYCGGHDKGCRHDAKWTRFPRK